MIMRKNLLLFIVALCATVAVNAKTITLEPGEKKIEAVKETLVDGDVIELQTGTYTEWNSLTFNTKVTIKAAEGAKPKLALVYFVIQNDFEINGIEISNSSKDNYLFRVYADVAGTVAFKNCSMQLNEEVTNPVSYINVKEGKTVGSLVVENCLFKPNAKTQGAVIGASGSTTTITNFSMINSTAYNCGNELTVWLEGVVNANVDHCTFYNCGTRVLYLKANTMNNYSVQNCVVANATETNNYCIASYAGEVKNCAYYNLNAPRGSDATVTGCINADPLFADPANGDFNFSVFSPLCFAATDGRHIGDPRWEAQSGAGIDLPTDATPVVLDKANVGAVSADMTYYGEDEEYFDFGPKDSPKDTLRWVKWLVNVNKRAYSVSAELTSANDYKLVLDVIDPSTGAVVLTSDTAKTPSFKTIDFSGLEEKSYILRLKNRQGWSKVKVKSLTFTYAGGNVVEVPSTDALPLTDAILSSGASVNEAGYIAYASATQDNARWNINATKAGSMSVTMDVAATDGHIYMVALYSMEGDSITAVKEKEWTSASGIMNLVGTIAIPQAGNYYVVVKNTLSHSHATFKDVILAYKGGGVVTIPETLHPADAMLSEKAFIDNDTIIFAPRGSEGHTPDGWAKWNVTLEKDALCSFKANCHRFSGNTMKIKISVINSENDTIYQKEENVENSGDSEVALGNIMLAAGDYVIQMQNTVEFSSGRLMSVVVTAQPIITITDDSDIDFTDYAGQMVTVQLRRTFKANMWNPICLPFGVEHSKLQSILNCETSYLLNNASLENQKLFVELAASQYNDIYNGSPYMIKPSEDVENPIFENVKIMDTPYASAREKGPLTLRGTFASHELENKENVLLVGANNTLFFPSDDAPHIKSMRAYFELQNVEPSQMPRFAAFIEPGNAPTEMIIVGGEAERQKGHRKVLVDGQIRIQHEGKCYSILGLER